MQVRIHLLPGKGSIGSMNVRGFNALVKAISPDATVYMTASKNDEKFKRAREIKTGTVLVVEVSQADYEKLQNKFGWKLLKDVPIDS
jgi:hypothetical protein